jgi:formylglycine-generating enzyme
MKTNLFTLLALCLLAIACNYANAGDKTTPVKTDTAANAAASTCTNHCKMPSRSVAVNGQYKGGADNSKMVLIPAGAFQMGSTDFEDTKPVHTVTVKSFLMDEHEVTNAQFAQFAKATGYQTVAERELNPKDFPGVPADKLVPGSAVFVPPVKTAGLDNYTQWWQYIPGASWKHPQGPKSTIEGKENDPVVQVCYEDAAAYAQWAGKRLPTEAEWEYAARAGKAVTKYYWGTEFKPNGKWAANIFQGNFPESNTKEDGYETTAPVKSFPKNAYGLYDMEGNVWEWCSDLYRPDYYGKSPASDPQGPTDSYDPEEPGVIKHVQRGGSFICSDQYCNRYKAGTRGKGETSSAGNNLGFRCVKNVK